MLFRSVSQSRYKVVGGGYEAVASDGRVVFSISPKIGSDGYVAYETKIFDVIDPKVTNFFDLSALKNGSYNPTGNNNTYLEGLDNTGNISVKFYGYEDAVRQGNVNRYDNTISTATVVQKSEQGIGVENNFITNTDNSKSNDGAGQKLIIEFGVSVKAVGLRFDQLDRGEVANWVAKDSAGNIVGQSTFSGDSIGASNSADQLFIVDPGKSFKFIELTGQEGTEYSILTTELLVILNDDPFNLKFGAVVTDADGDSVASSSFDVLLDSTLSTDTITAGTDGSDVFVLDSKADTIQGFNLTSDTLDLSNLLSAAEAAKITASNISRYLVLEDQGENSSLWLDADGTGGGSSWVKVVTLNGIDPDLPGVTASFNSADRIIDFSQEANPLQLSEPDSPPA